MFGAKGSEKPISVKTVFEYMMSMLHVFAKNGYEVEPVELKPTLPAAQSTPEEVGQEIAALALRGLRGIGGGIGLGI